MSTNREDVLQAARALCKATADSTALTDAQVIPADSPGPRPTSSSGAVVKYLTVRVGTVVGDGIDGQTTAGTTTVKRHQVGGRRASVSIQGFGSGSDEWLESIRSRLQLPAARAIMDANKIEFQNPGGVLNVSALLDTSIEPRFSLDIEACYLLDTSETAVAALLLQADGTLHDTALGDHIHVSTSVSIP